MKRREDIINLLPEDAVVAELGVARGDFSVFLLQECEKIKRLYSIDRWAGDRSHGDEEYMIACQRLRRFGKRSIVLRHTFEIAAQHFKEAPFDMVYVDGYAHTGQENGKTLEQWWPRVKQGGIFAGHDYSPKYSLTILMVDAFVRKYKLRLIVTKEQGKGEFPSWLVIK